MRTRNHCALILLHIILLFFMLLYATCPTLRFFNKRKNLQNEKLYTVTHILCIFFAGMSLHLTLQFCKAGRTIQSNPQNRKGRKGKINSIHDHQTTTLPNIISLGFHIYSTPYHKILLLERLASYHYIG